MGKNELRVVVIPKVQRRLNVRLTLTEGCRVTTKDGGGEFRYMDSDMKGAVVTLDVPREGVCKGQKFMARNHCYDVADIRREEDEAPAKPKKRNKKQGE